MNEQLTEFPMPQRHNDWKHATANPAAEISAAECYVCVMYAHYDRLTCILNETDATLLQIVRRHTLLLKEYRQWREVARRLEGIVNIQGSRLSWNCRST